MRTLIAVPCFDTIPTPFVESFLDIEKPDGTQYVFVKNTLIYNARNLIAEKAIENGFDRVLWLDSDMIVPENTLVQLSSDLDEGREIVSGLYFSRRENPMPVIFEKLEWTVEKNGNVTVGNERYHNYPQDAVFPIEAAGFGCIMTSVDLLKKMVLKYGAPFTPLLGLGEDVAFCWRVRQEGIDIYCDSRIKCGHIGQFVFDERVYLNDRLAGNVHQAI